MFARFIRWLISLRIDPPLPPPDRAARRDVYYEWQRKE